MAEDKRKFQQQGGKQQKPILNSIPSSKDVNVLPILIGLLLVFFTVAFFVWRRRSTKGRSVLLVGPCESGKTAIFARIVGGPIVQTVTSLVPNELDYVPSNGRPALILKDLPGHDRVQVKYWDSCKSGVRGIICVVDAAAGNKGIREAADILYKTLTDPAVSSSCPSVYIFANKQDLPTAKGVGVIRTQLEKELTTLRMTRSASLMSTKGKEAGGKILGRMDEDFDFDHLTHLEVSFGEGCGNGDIKELDGLFDWLDTVA